MTQNFMGEWIQTDELQWVMRISDDVFHVIEVTRLPDQYSLVTDMEIDLSHYSDEDLENDVSGYYDNLSHLKEVSGDSWKQIVAEIIAELNTENRIVFKDEEAVKTYLRNKHYHSF